MQLDTLAELAVSAKQVERVTHRIGGERVAERDTAVAAFRDLPLADKFAGPVQVAPSEVAVVMADGGRLQIRDAPEPTTTSPPTTSPPTTAELFSVAEFQRVAEPARGADAEGWEEAVPVSKASHWRENKIGLVTTMHSVVSDHDPCPAIPASFLDVLRIPRLVRELKRDVKAGEDAAADSEEPEATAEALLAEATYEAPEVQQRELVATRGTWRDFAPLLAQTAWAAGFQQAARQAFVGDGSANNWRLQRRYFGSFVPILDFIHALSYVFAAALAGRTFAVGWLCYQQWIRWVWQGQVTHVIAALAARRAELGLPAADEPATSPRQVVDRALTYLRNHQDKMHYDVYRKQGLPITSSLMESAVKQINRRVKGTEKFWSETGSEAVMQLRADYLSDPKPLETFWQRRQARATGQRPYRRAG